MNSLRKTFAAELLRELWEDYASRVPYARVYRQMLAELGGNFVNDHIAFRSLAILVNGESLGIWRVRRVFDALGFALKGEIEFPETHLFANYVQHEEPDFPKVFISELLVDKLDGEIAEAIRQSIGSFVDTLPEPDIDLIRGLDSMERIPDGLLERTVRFFRQLPWAPPSEDVLNRVNTATQYGAWVLLHGYNVNHFTGFVNRHGVESVGDIESLSEELKRRGVPMKPEIEGLPGSKLRQTSTEAVRVPVQVIGLGGQPKEIEWTYAYMEYAERGEIEENGKKVLFQGFLGPQASQLFDMTRLR